MNYSIREAETLFRIFSRNFSEAATESAMGAEGGSAVPTVLRVNEPKKTSA